MKQETVFYLLWVVKKIKLSQCLINWAPRRWGREGIAPPFLTSTLDGGEWPASHLGHFFPGETDYSIHRMGSWVNPRANFYAVEKRKTFTPPGFETQTSSPSLYQLSYPNSHLMNVIPTKWKFYIRTSRKCLQTVSCFTTEGKKSWNPKQFSSLSISTPDLYRIY
jgi:hypothetical protein